MILKSYLVEKNLSLIENYNSVLFYGENIGLKDEMKIALKSKYKGYESISFSEDEIHRNGSLLSDQLNNKSLFNDKKIIFLSQVSEKIKNKIEEIVENDNPDIKIFLFSENLDKRSAVRSVFEKSKNAGIIACYQDNHRSLAEYIKNKFQEYTGLGQEVVNQLIENSGYDRKIISNEIDKIKSLHPDKRINYEKIANIINNAYNVNFDDLRDCCLEGNGKKLNQNLGNVMIHNEDVFLCLNKLNYRIQILINLKIQFQKDKNLDLAINNLTPKIFWKDKPVIMEQFRKWNLEKLGKAKKNVIETEIKMKTIFNNYNTLIIKYLLIKLFRLANSTS